MEEKRAPSNKKLPSENVLSPVSWDIGIWTPVKYFKQF